MATLSRSYLTHICQTRVLSSWVTNIYFYNNPIGIRIRNCIHYLHCFFTARTMAKGTQTAITTAKWQRAVWFHVIAGHIMRRPGWMLYYWRHLDKAFVFNQADDHAWNFSHFSPRLLPVSKWVALGSLWAVPNVGFPTRWRVSGDLHSG